MKKILSILLSLCMVVTLMPQMAAAAGVTDSTPSVSAYATKAQLMDGTFAPNTSGTAANTGRLAFGKNSSGSAQEWYVLGNDSGVTGDNTVLFAASPMVTGQVFDGAFYSTSWKTIKNDKSLWSDCSYFGTVPNNVYPNHYGSSALRDKLQALADEKFTDAEKGMMNVTKISTRDTMNGAYFTTDMLYVPNGTSGTEKITAGSIDQKVLSMSSYWNEGDSAFWLRTPAEKDNEMFKAYSLSSMGYTGKSVVSNCVGLESDVRPAANINLSDVLFASSAVAGTSYTEATFGTIEAGKAMTLRLDGSDRNIGSVTYNAVSGDIKVNRGYTSLPVSLVVQGKDGSTDWYYSKKFLVNTSETVKADDIRSALDLSSKIDLSSCRIWLEAYSDPKDRGNGLIYAVEADREVDVISATYATREQLMYSFSPSNDGTAVNTGKILFGKDSDGTTPQEWYILGRDTGVSGYNTVLFAADPIVTRQAFEGTFNDISTKQEVNNKTVENLGSSCSYSGSVPTVVYLNHYGSSALRSKLQAVATENFNQTEQSLMNATTVTTKDTKKGTYYTTTDKLYALNGTYGEAKITAGSGNQKVLANSIYWWEADYFWLRTPGKGFNDPLVHDSAFVLHAGMSSNVEQYNVEHNAAAAGLAVQPAANLNLSSVLFASAADAASSDGAEYGTIASDKAMTLRLDGGSRNIGTVAYDPQTGDIKAVKGSTSGTVSLVVQTGDSYYTKMITGTQTVNKSEIKSVLGLAEIDLSSCHIWIEATGSDGMIYAVSANGCSTEAELLNAIDGGVTNVSLASNITLSRILDLSDKNITLDLNGYTLKGDIKLADSSAAPVSILTLIDSNPAKGGVLAGTVELTRGSYGTGSYLYANGGTVTARVSMNSYVAKIYCTSNTPSAFKNSVGNYGEIHGGIFYGSVKEDRIKGNTVTFMNGSSRYALEVVDEGKAAAAPVSPDVKAGYTEFDGWYNGETKYTFGSAVNENLTLTAGFGDPIEYTITYNPDGGLIEGEGVSNPEKYTVESDDITLNNPVKEGHVFTGWSETGVEGTSMTVTIPKGSTGDREYTANYAEVKNYTVTFDSNGGTQISPKTGLTAESKVLENVTNPAKQGYTFAGWKCGDTPVTDTTTCSQLAASATEITLTAQWTEKSAYEVVFDTVGGNSIDNKTGVKWTDKVLAGIDAPVREGYTFAGWKCGLKDVDVNSTYSELADNDFIPSITLTAQWKLNEIPDAPTGTISIGGNSWSSLSSSIAFDRFYKAEQEVTITATGSGTVSIGYLLSDTVLTRDELDGAAFDNYSESFRLGINHEHIVYAKLSDIYGNVTYINSGGIVIDAEAPVISGVEAGEAYCSSCRVTVTDKYLDKVTVNNEEVQLDKNNQFTLAAGENKITATDKAGNTASVTVNAIEGHKDADNDHKCDYCGLNASSHTDVNGDRICDICGEILSEEPVVGYVPSDKPVIENKGDGTISADLSSTTSTSDGTTVAAIDKDTADKIVDKVLENNSESIVIDATAKNQTAADSTKTSQLEIPTSALETIAEKTGADVTIKTDVAEVTIDNTAAGEIAKNAEGDTVKIILQKAEDTGDTVQYELKVVCSDGTVISDFGGGSVTVTVAVPDEMKDKKLVCVYIDDEGKYFKIGGTLNDDGTFTFVTEHFSTYAIMPEADADKVIKDQAIAAVKKVKTTVTLSTKSVKKGIKVNVKVPASKKADKTGIIIYRSTKKDSGYAVYKKVKTSGSTYTVTNTLNVKGNRLVKGKRYYYKVRVYRMIDGKTYYGLMSSVKYIRAK